MIRGTWTCPLAWHAIALAVLACHGCRTTSPDAESSSAHERPRLPHSHGADVTPPHADETPIEDASASLTMKDLDPSSGSLRELLIVESGRAHREGRRVFVEMRASWCAVCKRVDRRLAALPVRTAAADVVLLRVDTDAWADDLEDAGLRSPTIPAFYVLDRRGHVTGRWLDGHRLRDTTEIDAALRTFFAPP